MRDAAKVPKKRKDHFVKQQASAYYKLDEEQGDNCFSGSVL